MQTLSRLFKFEFMFRADATFEQNFAETLGEMMAAGELATSRDGRRSAPGAGHDGSSGEAWIDFYASVARTFLESYRVAARGLAVAPARARQPEGLGQTRPRRRRSHVLGGRNRAPRGGEPPHHRERVPRVRRSRVHLRRRRARFRSPNRSPRAPRWRAIESKIVGLLRRRRSCLEARLDCAGCLVAALGLGSCSYTPSPLAPNFAAGPVGAPAHGVLSAGAELPDVGARVPLVQPDGASLRRAAPGRRASPAAAAEVDRAAPGRSAAHGRRSFAAALGGQHRRPRFAPHRAATSISSFIAETPAGEPVHEPRVRASSAPTASPSFRPIAAGPATFGSIWRASGCSIKALLTVAASATCNGCSSARRSRR